MVVAETHGLTRQQGIKGPENCRMAKALGNSTRIKRVKGFFGRLAAYVHGELLNRITGLVQERILGDQTNTVFDLKQRYPQSA